MSRAIYDKSVKSRNLVTTITGVIMLLLTILVSVGFLTPEQSTELNAHAVSIVEAVGVIWGSISGIILIFKARDE